MNETKILYVSCVIYEYWCLMEAHSEIDNQADSWGLYVVVQEKAPISIEHIWPKSLYTFSYAI